MRSQREFQLAVSLREEGRVPSAIEHLRRSVELDPDNAESHILLGVIQLERGEAARAIDHLARGVELLVEQERQGSTLAEARNIYGLALTQLHRYDEAATVLRASATDELNTAPHLAWGNLALVYLEKHRPAQAEEALREAIRAQPRFCLGYYHLGRMFFEQERYEQAEEALVQALSADPLCGTAPAFQMAWRLRGETRAHLGRRDEAIADFERCVELGAETSDGRACRGFLSGAP